jgi:HD-GYP domain-containing protein (c-di-GMP phosphodiesterase class II)
MKRGRGSAAPVDGGVPDATGEAFAPVRLASLRIHTCTPFDLYVRQGSGRAYVLYRGKDLKFTEAAKQRLVDNDVVLLYVPGSQTAAYRQYVEANLGQILADPDLPVEQKSHVLYDSAMTLSKDVFENPRSGELFSRCEGMVRHEVAFVIGQKGAFENLLKVTSYDYYTYTHSVNVSLFCIAIVHAMGGGEQEMQRIGNGAMLHDVGKTMVPPDIINAPGKLSDEQWQIMRLHPVYGYNMLKGQGCTDGLILDMVRHHHEKLSGMGYPDRLGEQKLSEVARIGAVADIFDALTTRRSYKDALPAPEAFGLMHRAMGEELDLDILKHFVELVGDTPPSRMESQTAHAKS